MHAMTAAHRTYPLGSIVRVTNVKTGSTALVRITDRGPFIPGRVLDLSLAAAHKLDVWKPGVAEVKVELMQSPALAGAPGKWAVQIGGFPDEPEADRKLADQLTRRYHTAKVLRFASPAGDWWIRVRVLDDDHERAQKLAAETTTPEGAVFSSSSRLGSARLSSARLCETQDQSFESPPDNFLIAVLSFGQVLSL